MVDRNPRKKRMTNHDPSYRPTVRIPSNKPKGIGKTVQAKRLPRKNNRWCTWAELGLPGPCTSFHRFLDLPTEIRLMIYEFAFVADRGVIGSKDLQSGGSNHRRRGDKNWLAAKMSFRSRLPAAL